jgi:hypothetical protein
LCLILAAEGAKIAFLGDPSSAVPTPNLTGFSLHRFLLKIGPMVKPNERVLEGKIVVEHKNMNARFKDREMCYPLLYHINWTV